MGAEHVALVPFVGAGALDSPKVWTYGDLGSGRPGAGPYGGPTLPAGAIHESPAVPPFP